MKNPILNRIKVLIPFLILLLSFFVLSCDDTTNKDSSPCKDINCSNQGECTIDVDKPFCLCNQGYERGKNNDSCIFICDKNSSVNETNDGCISDPSCDNFICEEDNSHCEMVENSPKCLCNGNSSLKDGKCVLNPTCEATTCGNYSSCKLIEGIPECICDNNYTKINDSCIYNCSDQFSKPNSNNNGCVCIDNYILDESNNCILYLDPCSDTPCVDNDENKTKCIDTQVNQFKCICEDGYREDDQGICVELHSVHIRAVAGNVTSGNRQSYDLGHGIRIIQALKPDVVMLQEFNYNNDNEESFNELVELMFQDPGCLTSTPKRCYYYSAQEGSLPNGILSKYPIVESGFWDDTQISNRALNYVRVDIPGDKDLWLISVHLATTTSKRVNAARNLVDGIRANIPEDAYILLGGDFNTNSRYIKTDGTYSEETLNILDDIFYLDGPHPTDRYEEEGTNAGRDNPYDWVLATPNLKEYQVTTNYCDFELPDNSLSVCNYPNGLVFDTRDFSSTDLTRYFSPALTGDSDASQMQHMAVVKDFDIIFN